MAELNKIDCGEDIKNTGFGQCALFFKEVLGAIAVPPGKKFTKTDLVDLRTTLEAAILAAKGQRIYPFGDFRSITNNSEDPVFQTLGYGSQIPVRDGNNRWLFQYYDGGICLSNSLQSFNGAGFNYLFWDANNILFGTKVWDATTKAYALTGVPMDAFYAYPWGPADGANAQTFRVLFDFKPKYVNRQLGYVKADFDLSELKGLQNINLTQVGTSNTGVSQIQALSGCASENLFGLYSTELAAVALWKAKNVATGGAIAISAVAANTTLEAFTVTLDTADPNYPTTATDEVEITLVDAAALAVADIVGFEAIPVTVERG